jgi:catechol 2,3-dioxygenase-like lactoylglutathione lyase family enzyme
MSDREVRLDALNLVATDMEATLSFYRLLGLEIPEDAVWRTESGAHHVDLKPQGGKTTGESTGVDFDSESLARTYNAGFDAASANSRTVIGFRVATRDAVDTRYADLTSAGHRGLQPPYDTFWGARYAIVEDPDGRCVGIMSPQDDARRSPPPQI